MKESGLEGLSLPTSILNPCDQLSFPPDFRKKIWVGLGLGVGVWLILYFWTSYVDPGSTKDVDPGTCLTWLNHSDRCRLVRVQIIDHCPQLKAPRMCARAT